MRVHTEIVWDWSGKLLEDQLEDYSGPVSETKGSQTTIQQGNSAPWSAQQGYLTSGFQEAQNQFNSNKPSYYPNSTVVPYSAPTLQGMQQTQDVANSSTLPGQAAGALSDTLSGGHQQDPASWAAQFSNPNAGAMNPNAGMINPNAGVMAPTATNSNAGTMNPYLGQNPNAYIDQLTQSIGRSVIPGVQSQFGMAGRSGDSPMAQQAMAKGIADAMAPYQFNSAENAQQRMFTGGQDWANQMFGAGESQAARAQGASNQQAQNLYGAGADWLANMFGAGSQATQNQFNAGQNAINLGAGQYGQERQNQVNAISQAPGTEAARYAPGQANMNVGAMQEDLSGRTLQDAIDRFNFGQNIDQQKLADYMSLIQGNYGGTNQSAAQKKDSWNVPIPGLGSVQAK